VFAAAAVRSVEQQARLDSCRLDHIGIPNVRNRHHLHGEQQRAAGEKKESPDDSPGLRRAGLDRGNGESGPIQLVVAQMREPRLSSIAHRRRNRGARAARSQGDGYEKSSEIPSIEAPAAAGSLWCYGDSGRGLFPSPRGGRTCCGSIQLHRLYPADSAGVHPV
jgi:hypothetical protein